MAMRMTGPTRSVLAVFLDDPEADRYGLEIGTMTRLPSGTVHPILARLEGAGWLASDWEAVDPVAAGRPRRRHYRLTDDGLVAARAAVAAAEERGHRLASRLGTGRARPSPSGGVA